MRGVKPAAIDKAKTQGMNKKYLENIYVFDVFSGTPCNIVVLQF